MGSLRESIRKYPKRVLTDPDARKGMLSIFDQGFVSATNFLTGVIIGRSCTTEEFGLYALGFSLVLLISGVQHSLINTPYTIFSPRLDKRESSLYRGSALIHQAGLSVVFALGLAVSSLFFGSDPLATILRIQAIIIGFILLKEFIRYTNYASLNIGTVLCCDILAGILQIGGLLILAATGVLNSSSAFWIIGFSYGAVSVVWLAICRKKFAFSIGSVGRDLLHNWSFGKWVLASGFLYYIGMNSYPWILKILKGTGTTGIWAACLGIASLGNPIYFGMQNYLSPRLAHAYRENTIPEMKRFVFRASILFACCMLVFALFIASFGNILLESIYGSRYAGNGMVVAFLGFNMVVSSLAFTSSRSLFVMDRADIDFKTNFIVLILLAVLGISLVKMFGLAGAAYGLLLSNLISMVLKCGAFTLITRQEIQEAVG